MTDFHDILSELLFQHETVVLPGVGRFLCESQGAKVNVITNQFERPTVTVSFDTGHKDSDGLIVDYLCEHNQIPKSQAEQELEHFLELLNLKLQEGEEVRFPDIGVLSMDPNGELAFSQSEELQSNGDAFGLGDFTPTPVFTSEPQDDWKQRLAEQQRDKSTKMTVDKDVMYVENEEELAEMRRRRRRRTLRRVLVMALVLGLLSSLVYFKIIDIESIKKHFITPQEPVVAERVDFYPNPEVLRKMVSYYPPPEPAQADAENEGGEAVGEQTESEETKVEPSGQMAENVQPVEETKEPETTKEEVKEPEKPEKVSSEGWNENYAPPVSAKYFIVGGFFSEKQNALNHAQSLYEQGYPNAFLYPVGSKYYTCYGHYETKEEAKQALEEIKADTNPKAWLFERKR